MNLQSLLRDESIHPMTKTLMEDNYFCPENEFCRKNNKAFLVQIGFPAKDKLEGGDFYCPFNIHFEDGLFKSVVFGVNSMQALELSFQGIKKVIEEKISFTED